MFDEVRVVSPTTGREPEWLTDIRRKVWIHPIPREPRPLTPAARQILINRARDLSEDDRENFYMVNLYLIFGGLMTEEERKVSASVVEIAETMAEMDPDLSGYWHGGAPGLKPGDFLWPPRDLGISVRTPHTEPDRRDYVWFARGATVASDFGSRHSKPGTLYLVEPVGTVEVDPISLRLMLLRHEDPRKPYHIDELVRVAALDLRAKSARVIEVVRDLETNPELRRRAAAYWAVRSKAITPA